jgi:hypothetical protein
VPFPSSTRQAGRYGAGVDVSGRIFPSQRQGGRDEHAVGKIAGLALGLEGAILGTLMALGVASGSIAGITMGTTGALAGAGAALASRRPGTGSR